MQTPSVEENKEERQLLLKTLLWSKVQALRNKASLRFNKHQNQTSQANQVAQEQAREEQVQQLTKEYEANGYNVNVVRGK
ncbi:hypothetical protein [Lactococcus lactis]|uniref:hypothetical protein n=1 Tax=Lactococcus lactis TaxID=1358 RepID=UPI0024A88DF0|nr:hypothetical protein [Lactococcus lactis]